MTIGREAEDDGGRGAVPGNATAALRPGGRRLYAVEAALAIKAISRRRKKRSQAPSDFVREVVAEAVKSGLRAPKRKRLSKLQKTQRKIFRHAIAFLKRKGIVSMKIDARKTRSTSGLRKIVRENRPIVERKARVWNIPADFPPEALKSLKKAGYKVITGKDKKKKLVLPEQQYFRAPGKKRRKREGVKAVGVFQKPVAARKGGEIVRIKLTADYEQQVRDAFARLGKDEWIGFSIDGHNSYNIYQSADGMINDLKKYDAVWFAQVSYITIFRTKDPLGYLRERRAQRDAAEERYAENRRLKKQARRRVAESGLRVSRGR